MLKSPCKDCPDRFLGCHSSCERYKEFTDECKRVREIKFEKNRTENDWWRVTSTAYRKRKR